MDRKNDRIIYLSDGLLELHKAEIEAFVDINWDEYLSNYLTSRPDLVTKALKKSQKFIEESETKASEKRKYSILCTVPFVKNDKVLVNHSSTPLFMKEEEVRYWLHCLTHTPQNHQGIYLRKEGSKYYWRCTDEKWDRLKQDILNRREKAILSLSMQGYNVDEIAELLQRSGNTIKDNRKRMFQKLGVNNILEAVTLANIHKLL
ncbi:MAG: helix-turn-helix transcriptional regulator [Mediterranea sp.]|nr:helix-turn-helix transcriptional regulator [Mediterranea sp.]